MDTNPKPSTFDQELNTKVNELEIQRKLREGRSVELTLSTILDRVQPRQDAVSNRTIRPSARATSTSVLSSTAIAAKTSDE